MDELFTLVKDTLSFLNVKREKNSASPPVFSAPSVALKEKKQESIEIPKSEAPQKQENHSQTLKERSLEQMQQTMKMVFPQLNQLEAPTSIVFLCFHEKQLPFLESVKEAVCNNFLPASIHKIQTEEECFQFFQNPHLKLVVSPLKELAAFKRFDLQGAQVHEIHELFTIPCLLLANTDFYHNDLTLKRSLWNTLKNLPQLSPILPSIKL